MSIFETCGRRWFAHGSILVWGNSAMKRIFLTIAATCLAIPAVGAAQDLPTNDMPSQARPGQCYARVLVPATYRNEPIPVVTRDAYERLEARQPEFQTEKQTYVTSDPFVRYEVTEPTFRTETQTIVTRPAHERLEIGAATIGTARDTVVIRAPRLVWRSGSNLSQVRRLDPKTGEVFCLVEEAGVTQAVTRRILLEQAPVIRRPVPAETKTITRKILVNKATVREIPHEGTTETVHVHSLVRQAEIVRRPVPTEYATVNREVENTPERYEWVPVVCETGATAGNNIAQAQRALAAKGFYSGPIDGLMGQQTRRAIAAFQRQHGLAGRGTLTMETARHLER